MKAALARAAWKQQFLKPLIWTYHPFMLDMIEGMKTGPLLYHCVDDIAAVPGVDAKVFREVERVLLQRADVVFVTAPSLAEYCLKFNPNTHFLSNVVDVDHFGQALKSGPIPEDLACIPEPRLCYHGVLSDYKIDFQLLLDAARIKPEFSWIFIGDEREGQKNSFVSELKLLPNVYFLGYKPYTMLPDYLRGMQVGLLPSLINDYTRGMFPMKYYEYLAAGLPVTSTPLDFTTVEHSGIEIGFDVKSFVVAINLQLSRGRLSKNRVSGFVGNNTWKTRTLRMLNKIKWVCCCVVF
jgi:glycosyltransferase involved in cell wall biosynthesis